MSPNLCQSKEPEIFPDNPIVAPHLTGGREAGSPRPGLTWTYLTTYTSLVGRDLGGAVEGGLRLRQAVAEVRPAMGTGAEVAVGAVSRAGAVGVVGVAEAKWTPAPASLCQTMSGVLRSAQAGAVPVTARLPRY